MDDGSAPPSTTVLRWGWCRCHGDTETAAANAETAAENAETTAENAERKSHARAIQERRA
jgi:hypothetical protein